MDLNKNANKMDEAMKAVPDPGTLYAKTGMVLLEDTANRKFYYYRKRRILIPQQQMCLDKTYAVNDKLPFSGIDINGIQVKNNLLNKTDIQEILEALKQIPACGAWEIDSRIWKISGSIECVYDMDAVYVASAKAIRKVNYTDRVSLLQCIYLHDGKIIKSNGNEWSMDFAIWKSYGLRAVESSMRDKKDPAPMQLKRNAGQRGTQKQGNAPDKKEKAVPAKIKALLDCDKIRCRLEPYEEAMLYDIKRGHWELFGARPEEIPQADAARKLVAKDPREDINKDGVAGIDFGTKSTVVVRQNGTNDIIPIRIGTGVLSKEVEEKDYENPTVIECTDLDAFVKGYCEKQGRPETTCDDFFISYDAYHAFCACPPDDFYAYYAQLKQWANHEKEDVSVMDKHGNTYRFGQDVSLEGRQINPIELYAYYIGLHINNMRNGIYMKYLMSFPVGYPIETRQLILDSFEKGIKKSLPSAVLGDDECMHEFEIKLGISEPAAYAVTALELSGLDPKDETESYMYGIFDFGGGTADFDFGIWRGANEKEREEEGYDYVLECFGADSDVTLGGENILGLLAYHIFKENQELAREKNLTCSLPPGEQAFPGSEMLISNSQIADRNMSILKEELRPLWHQEKGWEEKYRHELIYENGSYVQAASRQNGSIAQEIGRQNGNIAQEIGRQNGNHRQATGSSNGNHRQATGSLNGNYRQAAGRVTENYYRQMASRMAGNNVQAANYEEYLEISLYDKEGNQQPNCRLSIDTNELIALIRARIQKGVQAFFRCMERTFQIQETAQKQDGKLYIFLAGNASRSAFVKELFEETIQDYYRKFKEMDERAGDSYFELIEPLNTGDVKEQGYKPNAKTGVAYGLVKSREGSNIKIVKTGGQARFKYYLGRERRRCFDCRLSPAETGYGEWVRFQGTAKKVVRIYFTTDPMADSKAKQLPIEHIAYKEITTGQEEGKFIFIRTCQPTVIQYAIAESEETIDKRRGIQTLDFDK